MIPFDYIRPSSQQSAIDAVSKNAKASFIAGGTNLVDLMKCEVTAPEKLVDINLLPLKTITKTGSVIRIGSLALNSEVAENKLVLENIPLLSMAISAGASPQIRNMATTGGNLMQRTRCTYFYDIAMPCNKRQPGMGCGALQGYNRMHAIFGSSDNCIAVHPSDMCVALVALDAVVIVSKGKAERRIPFADFHRLPGDNPMLDNNLNRGELITAIEIPASFGNAKNVHYLKIRDRSAYAFALVSVAGYVGSYSPVMKNVRLAMGGVAHKPWRLTTAEKFLEGKRPSVELFNQAADIAMKDAKGYGYNNFKVKMGKAAIVKTLKKIVDG